MQINRKIKRFYLGKGIYGKNSKLQSKTSQNRYMSRFPRRNEDGYQIMYIENLKFISTAKEASKAVCYG